MYELYYWPDIQGRGEFVRLALEDAGAAYVDVARIRGTAAMLDLMEPARGRPASFAPPFLIDGEVVVGQTAAILFYLGPRLGLAPGDEAARLWIHQLQLTIADLVAEAHDTHHPISAELFHESQKRESRRRARHFREGRIAEYLGWFEQVLARNPAGGRYLAGAVASYADLSLFQVVEGLGYAFPKTMEGILPQFARVAALHAEVAARPNIRAYLHSDRRVPFGEEDIFRHYPDLDRR